MIEKVKSKLKLRPLPNYQIVFLIIIMIFFRFILFHYDNDFWFTINQGRYVLNNSFPTIAINSIHDISFIYQSWGSGTLFWIIYNYLGLYGIISLLIVVVSLTVFFFYKLCFLVSNNKRGSLIITLITTILYLFYMVTRPHIFTVLNLVLMLYLLESYIKTDNAKYLYWLPLVSLLEINMHGIYFILLLIILTPYLINSLNFEIFHIKSEGYRKKPLFIAFLCMLLTGFINPYGYKTIIYGFSSYNANSLFNNSIVELLALNFHNFPDKVFIIVIVGTMILHFAKLKKMPLRYTLLLLGTSYLAFDALKSFYLFAFCSLFPLSLLYKKKDNIDKTYSKRYYIFHLTFTIIVCVGSLLLIHKPKDPVIKPFLDYLDEVETNKENLKIFTDYVDGSYAEFRGYYCYLDPRGEIFLKSNNNDVDIYEEYDDVSNLKINYHDFIDKYNFDYMIVKNKSGLGYLMKNDSYKYTNIMNLENHTLYKLNGE